LAAEGLVQFFESIETPRGEDELGAAASEFLGQGPADAGAGAGDDHDHSVDSPSHGGQTTLGLACDKRHCR
jgi:hypothetical protein